ncbi:hypothetical protein SELMODRAFT_410944 [Selaginella moellendorffii]|uniref:Uncharacterized protein n=1 Tax=Selaginella moellendorffii TaxID=88036 RepID=D8RGD3_SELML|nr:hypothetical protein SELMODRAFT_410944 [Selaginella moellendorffii]
MEHISERNKLAYFQKVCSGLSKNERCLLVLLNLLHQRLINIIALYKNKFCFHLKPIGLCNVCRHFAAPERSSLSGLLGCHICKCFLQNLRDRQSNWATANQQTFIVSRQSLQRSMAPLSPFHEISSLDLGKHVNCHIERQAIKSLKAPHQCQNYEYESNECSNSSVLLHSHSNRSNVHHISWLLLLRSWEQQRLQFSDSK